ncbi:MAG: Hsp70 family protein [Selenomonadaceae bacterium]|nr:Hsp70 family protein [Selenomonadaceae bacterium]
MNYIGIDLGTTNSVACTLRNGRYECIRFGRDETLPSVMLYKDDKITVGKSAKRKSVIYAENYISSAKTWMGDSDKLWSIDGRIFTPTDVATEVLSEIYKAAKKFFKNDDDIEAVITIPAYFDSAQRRETKIAGEAAGFIVKQILTEPVAAAVAYAFEENGKKEKMYIVDLGGGTFDVSLLESDGANTFSTLMKDGDPKLGGDDFDDIIVGLILSYIRKTKGINFASQEKSGFSKDEYSNIMQEIKQIAENVKCGLSEAESEMAERINLFTYRDEQYDLSFEITRDDFLTATSELRGKFESVIKRSFNNIDYTPADVDRVILVGGSANMPFVREFVEQFFDKQPYADMDLSKLVAMGAALIADEESDTITLNDTIAHSLGIELYGNKFSPILEKNRVYPCSETKGYTTTRDGQDIVTINVYEGENEEADKNNFYGGFDLDNIQIASAGVPDIQVTFAYDASCILTVTAIDTKTGSSKNQEIHITATNVKKKIEQPKQDQYDIALLLDASGSMYNSLSVAKDACHKLTTEMIDMSLHQVAFAAFESYVCNQCALTHSEEKINNCISSTMCGSSTNMTAAFEIAERFLNNSINKKLIIIVTDGYPDSTSSTSTIAQKLKAKGITIAAIGAGNVNDNYLSSLATAKNYYYHINDMGGLAAAFKSIAAGLALKKQ